jgi:hypothetical protein
MTIPELAKWHREQSEIEMRNGHHGWAEVNRETAEALEKTNQPRVVVEPSMCETIARFVKRCVEKDSCFEVAELLMELETEKPELFEERFASAPQRLQALVSEMAELLK